MHIFCMFQPPLYKNAWFTLFVGQELVRHMHFLRSPRSGKTCTPGKCMFLLHVSATSKNACCCMLLHVSSISPNIQGHIQKTCIFPGKISFLVGLNPSKNACCKGAPPHTVVVPQSTPGCLSWCQRAGFTVIPSASTYVC
jgi:hypothetical protein